MVQGSQARNPTLAINGVTDGAARLPSHPWPRTWGQKLKQKAWKSAAYWLAFHLICSVWCLIQSRPTFPVVVPPTVGWALPHQGPIMEMPHRLAHRPILSRHFFIQGSLFPDSSSLHEVDKILAGQILTGLENTGYLSL